VSVTSPGAQAGVLPEAWAGRLSLCRWRAGAWLAAGVGEGAGEGAGAARCPW